MTIKWVQVDPLLLNGEPFCYGSRVTVRQLLEMRAAGATVGRVLADHPELRTMGLAAAYCYAADHPDRYAEFLEPGGSLRGPGLSADEGASLPERYRRPGVVIEREPPSG
ncbi:MAG: DUF433 domain-containing protein [Chloroflexi bacterium]|jgi:uncharacterized protein (DUF433 family)|nr:DUF433 domain-containing protein [Chloroflexota bacterium]